MPFSGKFDYWQNYGDEKSRRSIPVIGEKGYSVWSIIGYYKLCKGNREQLLVDYGESLTAEELEAALAYYWAYPEGINRKLWEIAN